MGWRTAVRSHFMSSATNSSSSSPTPHFPLARLAATLSHLDQAEAERITENVHPKAANGAAQQQTSSAHTECSYSLQKASFHRKLNRWNDILTYDHSLLPGAYLNAALIPPYPLEDKPVQFRRSYIASQAPLPHTLHTFYDHVLDQRVRLIVNLTPFHERGRCKADEYWPLHSAQDFVVISDDADDHKLNKNAQERYIVRQSSAPVECDKTLHATRYDLSVIDCKQRDRQPYALVVLHVKAWADFGNFPKDVFQTLLHLIETIQSEEARMKEQAPPTWVHCSAGVGRSGTVIASLMARDLGTSVQSALALGSIATPTLLVEASLQGAYNLIDHTRRYRPRMVQTDEQVGMVATVVGTQLQKQQV